MRWIFIVFALVGCCGTNVPYPGQNYLGVRYENSPLGEGRAPDADPLIRFDAFDCTTFVETVLADGDLERLNNIRYKDGDIGFLNRNHFIESDWLVNNAGLVENVSSEFGVVALRHVVIDKSAWLWRVHGLRADFAPVSVDLEYLPYGAFDGIKINVPMIVLFITDNPEFRDKIGTDLAVVHMGILLPNGILRHASSAAGRVVDVDFMEYVAQRARSKTNIGISLVRIK